MKGKTPLPELVGRIIEGDSEAEEEMVIRYQESVYQIIYQYVRNPALAEDLTQDTLIKALEKIRSGEVREPERLSGFICAIARFSALGFLRKKKQELIKIEELDNADQVPDPTPDAAKQLLDKEKREIVRKVIAEMKIPRDREILIRYYLLEEDKEVVCKALQINKEQFNHVIFRAHQRFKEILLKGRDGL